MNAPSNATPEIRCCAGTSGAPPPHGRTGRTWTAICDRLIRHYAAAGAPELAGRAV
ncbi:hypothetical protein [Nonomuraea sp. PA05]|uniref:hypothetical protein n=1 Tax=Nonomuraea sp. PA05 TaxID=2604466 RepID=UPI0016520872|nr:hypothetical protein [Nonomuraea sp. PA05]